MIDSILMFPRRKVTVGVDKIKSGGLQWLLYGYELGAGDKGKDNIWTI